MRGAAVVQVGRQPARVASEAISARWNIREGEASSSSVTWARTRIFFVAGGGGFGLFFLLLSGQVEELGHLILLG